MNNTNLKLRQALYEERKTRLNLTQKQIAQKANISLNEYRQYENGEKEITIEFLKKIYFAGVDIQYMLTGLFSKYTYDDHLKKAELMAMLAEPMETTSSELDELELFGLPDDWK